MFSQATAATPSEAINRQLMEAVGVGNPQATAIAAAIEAANTNYRLDYSDANRVPAMLAKGMTTAQIVAAFTVSVALPTWSYPAQVWPWP